MGCVSVHIVALVVHLVAIPLCDGIMLQARVYERDGLLVHVQVMQPKGIHKTARRVQISIYTP